MATDVLKSMEEVANYHMERSKQVLKSRAVEFRAKIGNLAAYYASLERIAERKKDYDSAFRCKIKKDVYESILRTYPDPDTYQS